MKLQEAHSQQNEQSGGRAWESTDPDFILLNEVRVPERIAFARERMLLCRLYIGLIRTLNDDYGAEFARHTDSATYRTIGIYVFLRTVMCSPVRASTIAQVLKIPRATVLRRLQDMVKNGYHRARRQRLPHDRQGQYPRVAK